MKKYFFYSATGQGVITLQFPTSANSVGVAQDPKIYQKKLSPGAVLSTVLEGATMTETALIAAIVAAFSGAKVVVEDAGSVVKKVYLLN